MKNKDTLTKIDEWFAEKGKSASTYLSMAFLVALGIGYFILSDPADRYHTSKSNELNDITKKLDDANDLLQGEFSQVKINQLKQQLKTEQNELASMRDENNYFDGKLRDITALSYNQKNWAGFLDSLSSLAENNNIKLFKIDSETKTPNLNKLKPQALLDVNVTFEGAFPNILRYINSIEESAMIVDLNNLDFNATGNGNVGGMLGVSIWGVKYQ